LCQAQHLSSNANTTSVQTLNCILVALSKFAQNCGPVDANIVEMDRASGRAADAQLILRFANAQTWIAAINDEARDSLVALGRVNVGKDLK
jgi:hypothetical protein